MSSLNMPKVFDMQAIMEQLEQEKYKQEKGKYEQTSSEYDENEYNENDKENNKENNDENDDGNEYNEEDYEELDEYDSLYDIYQYNLNEYITEDAKERYGDIKNIMVENILIAHKNRQRWQYNDISDYLTNNFGIDRIKSIELESSIIEQSRVIFDNITIPYMMINDYYTESTTKNKAIDWIMQNTARILYKKYYCAELDLELSVLIYFHLAFLEKQENNYYRKGSITFTSINKIGVKKIRFQYIKWAEKIVY